MAQSAPPRILPVERPDEEQAELLGKTLLTEAGKPLNLFATIARSPRLLRRFNALGGYFLRHGLLCGRDRELAILRVAALTGCDYEWAQHQVIGVAEGLSAGDIERVRGPVDAWSGDENQLLRFVDEVFASEGNEVPSWDGLATRYDDQQMMELVLVVGFYRMLAGFINAVRVEIDTAAPRTGSAAATGQGLVG